MSFYDPEVKDENEYEPDPEGLFDFKIDESDSGPFEAKDGGEWNGLKLKLLVNTGKRDATVFHNIVTVSKKGKKQSWALKQLLEAVGRASWFDTPKDWGAGDLTGSTGSAYFKNETYQGRTNLRLDRFPDKSNGKADPHDGQDVPF